MVHSVQLSGRKVFESIDEVGNFENDIKSIEKIYNHQNPKNLAQNLAKSRNEKPAHITYVFVTRWADGEQVVLKKLQ